MTHWPTVQRLFDEALALDPAERAAFLKRRCAGDAALLAEVSSLVASAQAGDDFLERPAWLRYEALVDEPLVEGRHVGPYRLVRRIATGGSGIVYEAEQTHPRRRVALKLLRGGSLLGNARLRSFRREGEALARLAHPSIAVIHDAGSTEDGLHYLVMELVEGLSLDAWVCAEAPDRRTRLDVFLEIGDAVAHAHERGVIHRDLKSANILVVTPPRGIGVPSVKILDFGLARLERGDLEASVTQEGQALGTFEAMSPEQARGEIDEVDERTDVYALGALLYRLLTDRPPLDLAGRLPHEAVRIICEHTPPLAGTLDARLRGDLETILEAALAKDPTCRYASVSLLLEDLRRHLAGDLIRARAPTRRERMLHAVRRHKLATALFLGTLATALVLSIALVRSERAVVRERLARAEADATAARERVARQEATEASIRALHEAETKTEILGFLRSLFTAADPETAPGSELTVRELLDTAGQRLATELSDRPLVAAEIHTVLGQTFESLGLYDRARTHLEQALATLAREHGPEHAETGRSLVRLGRLAWDQGDYASADEILTRAARVLSGVLAPDDPELAIAHADLASARRMSARPDEARALYEDACRVLRRAFPDDPATAEVLSDFAGLHAAQGRLDDAAALYTEALGIFRIALPADHPHLAVLTHNLAALESRRGNHAAAGSLHAIAAERLELVYGPEHPHVGTALHGLGMSHWRQRELGAAEAVLRRALAIRRGSLGDHPHVASTLSGLAQVLEASGRPAEAVPLLDETIAIYASQTVVDEVQLRLARALRETCLAEASGTVQAATPP